MSLRLSKALHLDWARLSTNYWLRAKARIQDLVKYIIYNTHKVVDFDITRFHCHLPPKNSLRLTESSTPAAKLCSVSATASSTLCGEQVTRPPHRHLGGTQGTSVTLCPQLVVDNLMFPWHPDLCFYFSLKVSWSLLWVKKMIVNIEMKINKVSTYRRIIWMASLWLLPVEWGWTAIAVLGEIAA